MIPWSTPAAADVASPTAPARGTVVHDLPPPEAPPAEVPSWALPGGAVLLALLVLGAFLGSRARRRRAG